MKDRMLTFLCDDFEEVCTDNGQTTKEEGLISPRLRGTASFRVRCVHDGNMYTATFFTSEMDKVSFVHFAFCT